MTQKININLGINHNFSGTSGKDIEQKKLEIKNYFNFTFNVYEKLFNCLNQDQAFYKKPDPLRHPLIFYLAHTSAFFINKLITAKLISNRINSYYESIFSVGVDEMSWDDLNENHFDWPSVSKVKEYRKKVKKFVNQYIDTMELKLPITQEDPAWIILMGIEHEKIHLETSCVLIRMLNLDDVNNDLTNNFKDDFKGEFKGEFKDNFKDEFNNTIKVCTQTGTQPINEFVEVKGQKITLGKTVDDQSYGWDNEFGIQTHIVDDFSVSKYLVSNGEFLEFIFDNGYHNNSLWSEEGKSWLKFSQATMPRFWIRKENKYRLRNLTSEMPLPLDWPVELNFLESVAFCNWKELKINEGLLEKNKKTIQPISEAQWFILREKIDQNLETWKKAPGNINLEYFASSCPVNTFETDGIFDIVGNVWQWTSTPINGFKGFEVHPAYDDFSVPTFDGRHNIIKGGSWISMGNLASKSARYSFRRHFFQFAGLRYVSVNRDNHLKIKKGKTMNNKAENIYERDQLVSQYLEFHYGREFFNVSNFPVACVNTLMEFITLESHNRCLDLGCSVGRSTFELANYFNHVDGIDFSARFIQMASAFQSNQIINYKSMSEGDLFNEHQFSLDDFNFKEIAQNISFSQSDACNLKPHLCDYDLIFCGNLIDRLYDPVTFLETIDQKINKSGYLVLTSPYTWLEEYTPKEKWIGGFTNNQTEEISTFMGLKNKLEKSFHFIKRVDIPFVIKETDRKFQHTVAEMTIWQKK